MKREKEEIPSPTVKREKERKEALFAQRFLPKVWYIHARTVPTNSETGSRGGREACTTYKQVRGGIYREVHTRVYQEVSLRCIYHPGIPGGVP